MSWLTKLATAAVQRQNRRLLDATRQPMEGIRRRDAEWAQLHHAHAKTMRELADTRDERDEIRQALADLVNKTLALSTDTLPVDEELAQLRRRLQLREVDLENLRAERRRWLGHYDVCERAQAVADHDRDQAASNR